MDIGKYTILLKIVFAQIQNHPIAVIGFLDHIKSTNKWIPKFLMLPGLALPWIESETD